MAHAISFLNDFPVAFLSETGASTWHGLETRVWRPVHTLLAGLKTYKESLKTTSGLDIRQQAQVMEVSFNGQNTRLAVGCVGKNYTVQTIDAIIRRVEQLEEVGIVQEFAASLADFGEIMLTFKVGSFSIFGKDQHDSYMTMVIRFNYLGHDEIFASIVRAICKNTQLMARSDAKGRKSWNAFRHSKSIDASAEFATRKLLGLDEKLGEAYQSVQMQQAAAEAMFTRWAEKRVNETQQNEFVKSLFAGDSTQAKNAQDGVNDAIGHADTAYDWFNGLTLFNKTGLNVRMTDSENAPQGAQLAAKVGADLFGKGAELRTEATNWIETNLFQNVMVTVA